MAHKTEWLNFYIVLADVKQVKTLKAAHPHGVMMAPLDAATLYNAPWHNYDQATAAPYSWTPWSGANSKGGVYPLDVQEFTRKSGGFWIFGGTTTKYIWLGNFQTIAEATTPADVVVEGPIALRRWIEGFEIPGMTSVGTTSNLCASRDAARHVGGMGLAFRGADAQAFTIALNAYGYNTAAVVGGLINNAHSWERFYLRLRRAPTIGGAPIFWRCSGTPSSGAGIRLAIMPTGQIAVYGSDAANNLQLLGTVSGLTAWDPVTNPNAWHRFDLFIKYGTPAGVNATLTIYVDGFVVFQSGANCYGLNGAAGHASSQFSVSNNPTNDLELDIDDWINADIPYLVDGGTGLRVEYATGKDWLNGSKIVGLHPSAFSSNHNASAWPGDFRTLVQQPFSATTPLATLTSSTSGGLAAVNVDDATLIEADKGQIGVAAVLVGMMSSRNVAGASGQVGLTANGVTTMVAATQGTSLGANAMLKSQPGTAATFEDFTPIELRHTKGADATASFLATLAAQAELIGQWGKEDVRAPNTAEDLAAYNALTFPTPVGQHNAQYPNSPWAVGGNAPPISPFIVKSGTYVGNNTGQDLAFRAPVNWLFIRRVGGGTGVYHWFSTMLGSHSAFGEGIRPQMTHGVEDTSFAGSTNEQQQQSYVLRITGTDSGINAVGATYQYLAVCDPGMRYMLNAACGHRNGEGTIDNKLVNAAFRPDFAFLQCESAGNTSTQRLYGKGPGNAADTVSGFASGAAFGTAATFGTGLLTTRVTLHGVGETMALNLWRKADGNADPGQPGTWQTVTWTGDGAASRTVGLTPSGLRPLFAMVFSEATTGMWRDPSHTTTNSANSTGTDTASGITAGAIDSFTVGSTLNTNGVIYNAFILMGSATAGNGGWSVNGEFENADFYSPTDGPWGVPPAEDDPTLDPEGTGEVAVADANPFVIDEPDLDNALDLPGTDHVCVYFTQRIVNEALGLIGVSKTVVDLRLDTTIEANVARVNMRYDVETTLRDYPWPFATSYRRLELVAGSVASPVNADWTYSYRRPWDCVFERRLVVPRGTTVDPAPPPFAIGSDTGGGLLYCNVANATLEYTGRKQCPTYEGDVLFRDALTWRVAMRLAPALTRIEGKLQAAHQGYELALQKARLILTPGKPGSVAPVVAIDTTATQIAANVNVVNRALVRIGARTISSFNEQSREAEAALVIFEDELRSTLRDFPWPFATAYASPLTLVAGTATVGANSDWTYSYRVPTDLVYARRLVTSTKRAFDANPPPFKIATDGTGGLLYTNQASAVLEYTTRPAGAVAIADALFRDAFAWRLAASLAPSLAEADPEVPEQFGRGPDDPAQPKERRATRTQIRRQAADRAWQMYQLALRTARVAAANEQQRDPTPPDAPWILGR